MSALHQRTAAFNSILDNDSIDLVQLAELCLTGIPDTPKTLRPRCWRLLLGYEPTQQEECSAILRKQRQVYYSFVNDLLVDPFLEASKDSALNSKSERKGKKGKKSSSAVRVEAKTNPLTDEYAEYYADNLTLEQIDKDVRRTLADIAFFQQAVPISHQSPLSPHLRPKMSMEANRPSIDMQLDQPMMTTLKDDEPSEED